MRIIFLSPHSDPQAKLGEPDSGGQCIYEHELAINLSQIGHQVLTFCRLKKGRDPVTYVNTNYTIYRLRVAGEKFLPKEMLHSLIPEFTDKLNNILSRRIKNLIPRLTPSIIHAHYWDGAAVALRYKALHRDLPMVWTPHSLGFMKRDKFKGITQETFFRFIPRLTWENYAATAAERIIVSSFDEKRKLSKYYSVSSERIFVIPPGISLGNEDRLQEFRSQWNLGADTKVLMTIGRITRNKGYHHAIRILSELKNISSRRYKLIIVGGGQELTTPDEKKYFRELKALITRLRLNQDVTLQPSIPHHLIHNAYNLTDIFLMTSEDEPFGLTVVEAMMMGKVVLAHKEGGSRSIITTNSTGFIVDMHKYREVAAFINKLISNPARMNRVGARAKSQASIKYSWQSRLPGFVEIYQELAHARSERLKYLLSSDSFLQSNLGVE